MEDSGIYEQYEDLELVGGVEMAMAKQSGMKGDGGHKSNLARRWWLSIYPKLQRTKCAIKLVLCPVPQHAPFLPCSRPIDTFGELLDTQTCDSSSANASSSSPFASTSSAQSRIFNHFQCFGARRQPRTRAGNSMRISVLHRQRALLERGLRQGYSRL